jgi:hypothetical protein
MENLTWHCWRAGTSAGSSSKYHFKGCSIDPWEILVVHIAVIKTRRGISFGSQAIRFLFNSSSIPCKLTEQACGFGCASKST